MNGAEWDDYARALELAIKAADASGRAVHVNQELTEALRDEAFALLKLARGFRSPEPELEPQDA